MANHLQLNHSEVVILGGGISGLSAAEHFQKNGFQDWKILEAAQSLGGRIKTTEFGDSFIEEGANWIHGGSTGNCIFEFGVQKHLLPSSKQIYDRRENMFCTSDGTLINKTLSLKVYDFFKGVEEKTEEVTTQDDKSLFCYMNEMFQCLQNNLPLEERFHAKCIFNHFHNYVAMHAGDDGELLSTWGYGEYETIAGGDIRISSGYDKFIQALTVNLPTENIRLNHEVSSIKWDSNPILITCANGIQFTANYVVVTIPLGVLKASHLTMFHPVLPNDKVDVINRMGFGRVCKIFLQYDVTFWETGNLNVVNFAWSDADIKRLENTPEFWTTALLAVEEIPHNRNVLFCWIGGHCAAHVETLYDNIIARSLTQTLINFLPNRSIPLPSNVLVTRWCGNPFSRGTYSYLSVESGLEDINTFSRPLKFEDKCKVLFAGEAAHAKHFSTVHGARATGMKEAKNILLLKEKSPGDL